MSVGDRVKSLREAKEWSQARLAKEVKKLGGKISQQNIANIESGIVKQPKALMELAEVFDVLPHWLQTGKGSRSRHELFADFHGDLPPAKAERRRLGPLNPSVIPIRGEVAAGQWLDVDLEFDERDFEQYPIAAHPAYPFEAQYGLIVRGNSMNRVAVPGDVLHCLDYIKAAVSLEDDDVVIVERRRAQEGQREVTAKRISNLGRLVVLSPDSTEGKWKPIEFDPKASRENDNEEIRVLALVLAIYKPLKKRK